MKKVFEEYFRFEKKLELKLLTPNLSKNQESTSRTTQKQRKKIVEHQVYNICGRLQVNEFSFQLLQFFPLFSFIFLKNNLVK